MSSAPLTLKGRRAPGGTFISERIERASLTSWISQPISASASASSHASGASGQRAVISMASRGAPKSASWVHSSSVTNGLIGCSSFSAWSSTQAVVARVSALAASSAPFSTGLDSSRYQSQNTFQTKR